LYLANLCGWNCIRDYRYYNYGPYSDVVATELENFKRNNWVEETSSQTNENKIVHSYSITAQGQKVADSLAAKVDDERLIKRTMNLVKELYKFSSDDLEMMATIVFLRRSEPNLSDDALVRRVRELKLRFGEEQIRSNMRIFNILRDFGYNPPRLPPIAAGS